MNTNLNDLDKEIYNKAKKYFDQIPIGMPYGKFEGLNHLQTTIYRCLYLMANTSDEDDVFTSHDLIAEGLRVCRQSIFRALHVLRDHGYIIWHSASTEDRRNKQPGNHYYLIGKPTN